MPATMINPRIPDPSSRKLEGSGVGVGATVELNVAESLKVKKSKVPPVVPKSVLEAGTSVLPVTEMEESRP